jgi:hypothetical protein
MVVILSKLAATPERLDREQACLKRLSAPTEDLRSAVKARVVAPVARRNKRR